MRVTKRWLIALGVAGLLLVAPACTNDDLDDGGGADVVLQIQDLTNDPVTASGDPSAGTCSVEVQAWSGTIAAVPLNEIAVTEFSNVRMQDVTIIYDWIDPTLSTPTRVVGMGGVTVPVNGTGAIQFEPIAFDDVTTALLGRTANLTLVFRGLTQDNEVVTETVQRQLFVEACSG